jgi:beta-carotene 3-hydroxylase
MDIALYIIIVIATFFGMEWVAWATHKFLMHGPMWYFHKDHHQKEPGFFEKNDVFFLIFAVPSWLCIMLGLMNQVYWVVAIGAGIAVYGIAYFIVHELIIHQRFKVFTHLNNKYIRAIRRAHRAHHARLGKEDGVSFGMLIVAKEFFQERRKR